jgi:hypothetical protein
MQFNYYSCNSAERIIILTRDISTHSWSGALLEKPPIVRVLKNFPAFYGT